VRLIILIVSLLFITSCSHKKAELIRHDSLKGIGAKLGDPVYLRIFKKEHILELWVKSGKKYRLYKQYPILKLSGYLGPKRKEGDRQNPEGVYRIYKSSLNPRSKYHLSMDIGYPNIYDIHLGRTGSHIMIHGSNKSIGCFAMGDGPIEEIYRLVESALDNGQKFVYVAIFPFIMNEKNMKKYERFKSLHTFWRQLQNIYDIFEIERVPPKVIVLENSYLVEKE